MPSELQLRSGAPCQPSTHVPRTPTVIESACGQSALSETTALQRRRVHVPTAASHEPLALHARVGRVENPKPSTHDPIATEPGDVDGHITLFSVSAGHEYSVGTSVNHYISTTALMRTFADTGDRLPRAIGRAGARHGAIVAILAGP